MIVAAGVAALLVAWMGGCLITLGDGRRSHVTGILLIGAGLGTAMVLAGTPVDAFAVLGGSAVSALARAARPGRSGWGLLPEGSTPRVVACLALGAAGLWLAGGLLTAPGDWESRAAPALAGAVCAARLLTTGHAGAAYTAAVGLALALGVLAGLGPASAGAAAAASAAGALVAVAISVLPEPARA